MRHKRLAARVISGVALTALGAALARLLPSSRPATEPQNGPRPADGQPESSRHFPFVQVAAAIGLAVLCFTLWPRPGELPISKNSDFIRLAMPGAERPYAYWDVVPAQDGSYTLSSVELVIGEWGEGASDLSVAFHGVIANGAGSCHAGTGEGLFDGFSRVSYELGSEKPIGDEINLLADELRVDRSVFEGNVAYQQVRCTVDPEFVFSSDGATRRYAFPPISIDGRAPLVVATSRGEPLFDIDSGLFASLGELAPTVTTGSFTVPAENESRENLTFGIGIALGVAGGLLTPLFGWFDSKLARPRQPRPAAHTPSLGN